MKKNTKKTETKAAKAPAKKILTVAEYEAQARTREAAKAAQGASVVAPVAEPKAKAEPKARKAGGLDAAAQVLAGAKEPLSTKVMVERMLAQGLWQTDGKTPEATIYAAIIREIAAKGEAARFRKTDRGRFALAG